MKDQNDIKLEINIAGERIILTVPASMQKSVKDTERNVNSLFNTWRRDFPDKHDKELLAMMAYQYASYFYQLSERLENARRIALDADQALQKLVDDGINPDGDSA